MDVILTSEYRDNGSQSYIRIKRYWKKVLQQNTEVMAVSLQQNTEVTAVSPTIEYRGNG
ncbi:hypothetical protein BgiBS90_027814, partial [Biomphalaria glabrata]